MEPRVTLITLGVSDLTRARTFYERLGWRGQEAEETVFFQGPGHAIVLWSRAKLADDGALHDDGADAFGGVALAHNVASREEVDRIVEDVIDAGGEVTKPPAETFYGGYAAYFRDPDGHVWEVAHNPSFTLHADGTLTLPDFGAR